MKKKLIISIMATCFIAITACGKESNEEPANEVNVETSSNIETDNDLLGGLGDVETDKNLFSVEITIPADIAGEITQDELDKEVEEKGYKSATINPDKSVTYIMSKKQHQELLEELEKEIKNSLNDIVGSDECPNITKIETNDNFSEFEVTTKSEKLDLTESMSVISYYMYGGIYNIYAGNDVDGINVKFINADTGEIIEECNSKDANNSETKAESENENQSDEKPVEDYLNEIKNWYIGEIWNNFVDFDSYRKTGKDCTGSDIDIEFAYDDFKKSYTLKDGYDSYINNLPDEYDDLKSVWGKMNEQIESIYDDLEENGLENIADGLKLDLLRQYSDKFYDYIGN